MFIDVLKRSHVHLIQNQTPSRSLPPSHWHPLAVSCEPVLRRSCVKPQVWTHSESVLCPFRVTASAQLSFCLATHPCPPVAPGYTVSQAPRTSCIVVRAHRGAAVHCGRHTPWHIRVGATLPWAASRLVFGVSRLGEGGGLFPREMEDAYCLLCEGWTPRAGVPRPQTLHGSTCVGPVRVAPMGLGDVVNDADMRGACCLPWGE